jgi:hypothetical protein
MAPVDSGLKEAIWLLLEITSHQQPGQTIHSDFIIRKFPKINEVELLNAIGALVQDGKISVKASSVDAHGNATAYHIRILGQAAPPDPADLKSSPADFAVGFGDTKVAESGRETRTPEPPKKVGLTVEGGKIGITPDTGGAKEEPRPDTASGAAARTGACLARDGSQSAGRKRKPKNTLPTKWPHSSPNLPRRQPSRKRTRSNSSTSSRYLMAMFQSADAESFTTPIAKLASLKRRVDLVAPELVPDYILLCQNGIARLAGTGLNPTCTSTNEP